MVFHLRDVLNLSRKTIYVALPLSMPESKGLQVNRGHPVRRENRGCRAIKGCRVQSENVALKEFEEFRESLVNVVFWGLEVGQALRESKGHKDCKGNRAKLAHKDPQV